MQDLYTHVNIGDILKFLKERDFYTNLKIFNIFTLNFYVRRMEQQPPGHAKDRFTGWLVRAAKETSKFQNW